MAQGVALELVEVEAEAEGQQVVAVPQSWAEEALP